MFKLLGVLSQAIIDIITSIAGVTKSLDNVVESCNAGSNALLVNAKELEADVIFECEKKQVSREAAMAEFKATLLDLTEE